MAFEMTGMSQLLNQLGDLGTGQDMQQIKKRAMEKGAEHLRQKIAQNTPKSSISKRHAADNVVIQQVDDEVIVGYAEEFFYMMFQEFGTSKISANPVVQRTFEREIETTQSIMMQELRRGLGL